MENNRNIKPIPSARAVFRTLLRADFRVQWRNRRSLIMGALVPIIFIISWKGLIPEIGGANVLAICTAVALPAIGLMGYSQSLARDRERGVFQRLRAAPIPTWTIMTSRILVQLSVIALITVITIVCGYFFDKITIGPLNIIVYLIAALIGGLSFIALGQLVVAFITGTEAVNSAVRLIYFPIAIVGALGQIGLFGALVQSIVTWSPLGTTKTMLVAAATFQDIDLHLWIAVAVTLAYGVVFAGIGISRFKWAVE